MAKRYGAAVIALTIDEDGMALTADKKVAIAHRIHDLATKKYGLDSTDLIFDALTLPISTGQEEYRTAGMETLKAVERIKKELPNVKTILGVSNISFGLDAYSRRVLNSVFMHEAVDHGLDMAIVNYTKIYPLYKIPQEEVELARKLIFRDASAGDPLQIYMQHFAGTKGKAQAQTAAHVETLVDFGVGRRQCLEQPVAKYAELQVVEQPVDLIPVPRLHAQRVRGLRQWYVLDQFGEFAVQDDAGDVRAQRVTDLALHLVDVVDEGLQ